MVAALLIVALLMGVTPGYAGQPAQLCLSCHPTHYAERGRCSGCHRGNQGSERKNIAHAGLLGGKYALFTLGDGGRMREGERLMNQFACRRCHVSAGRGNPLAVGLDDSAARKTAEELVLAIRHPAAAMPKFDLNEEQITLLVNIIFAGSRSHHTAEAAPVRVHFNTSGKKSADVFSTKCGSCHRLLSQRLGSVGTGEIGPNLSALFSEFYPKNFKNGEAWGSRNLGIWRKNPREIRPWARMQPVTLTEMEIKELESIIQITSEAAK